MEEIQHLEEENGFASRCGGRKINVLQTLVHVFSLAYKGLKLILPVFSSGDQAAAFYRSVFIRGYGVK